MGNKKIVCSEANTCQVGKCGGKKPRLPTTMWNVGIKGHCYFNRKAKCVLYTGCKETQLK